MKKSLLRVVGRTSFWLGWPVLYFFLRGTTRTRVVIAVGNKILVTRSWLGDGKWELPGGGAHKGETIEACAIREVMEETGIVLETQQLVHSEGFNTSSHGMSFRCEPYFARLESQPAMMLQKIEISDLHWISPAELDTSNTETGSLGIIAGFRRQNLL